MPNIDEIEYPDEIDHLLKHKKLGPMFRRFIDQRNASENYRFLDATHRRIDPKTLYPIFIGQPERTDEENMEVVYAMRRGETPLRGANINIPSAMRTAMKNLADANDWTPSKWQKYIKSARVHILNLLEFNFRFDFFQTQEFKDHHKKRVSQGSDDTPFSGNDIMEMLQGLGLPNDPMTTAWLKQIADNIQAGALAKVEKDVQTLIGHHIAETEASNRGVEEAGNEEDSRRVRRARIDAVRDELHEKIMYIAMTAENLMDGNENLPGNNPNPSKTVDRYVEKVAAALKNDGKKAAASMAMNVARFKRANDNLSEPESQIAKDLLREAKIFNTAMDKYERKDVLRPGENGEPPAGYKKQLQSISFMLASGEPEDARAAAKELAENLRVLGGDYAYINEAAILERAADANRAPKPEKIWTDKRMMAARKEFLKQYSDKANGRPKPALAHALSVARKIGPELGFSGALDAKIVLENLLLGHDGPGAAKGREAGSREVNGIVATAEQAENVSGKVVPIDVEDNVDGTAGVTPQRGETMARGGMQTRFKASSEAGDIANDRQINYDMATLRQVKWPPVMDLYSIASDESEAASDIAKLIIKKGMDSPEVIKSSKSLLSRSRKKGSVAKVKKPQHLAAAIEDALIKKADKKSLSKPLKFADIPDDEKE